MTAQGVELRTRRADASALRPAVGISAVRCLVVYVLVPMAGPFLGASRWVAAPIVLTLLAVGTVLSARALVQAWRSETAGRMMVAAALLSLNLLAIGNVVS